MPLVLADRVKDTTTSTGTGTVSLSGTASVGYQTFAAIGNGNSTYYTIAGQGTAEWEVGVGTYTAVGTTLSRDTVLASSNGGALVSFSAGTKDVFVTYPAGKSISNGYGTLPVANGGTGATSLTSGYLLKGNGTSAVSASVVYESGGNVGIGTSSPNAKLEVSGDIAVTGGGNIRSSSTSSVWSISGGNTYNNGGSIIVAGSTSGIIPGGIAFNTGTGATNTERMRIDADGNVLIGISTVGWQNAYGFQFSGPAGGGRQAIMHASGSPSGQPYMDFVYNGAQIGSITQSGTTGVAYNTTSDQRLKTNIADAGDAGPLIDRIKVRQYEWVSDGTHQDYGFVAQELVEVVPYAVHTPANPDEMMAVDYSKVVPLLVKEIQSLRARVAALEAV